MKEKLKEFYEGIGLPRLIIAAFLLFLFILGAATRLPLPPLIGDSLRRIGMNGILVLAMVPTIRCGVGLNFGLPLGIICGLIGVLISMQFELTGFVGFLAAVIFCIPFAILTGMFYAWLLSKVRGQEMMVGTYVGFSTVAFMCIMWLILPFDNPEMIWALGGKGLRYTLSLENYFGQVLNNFWAFEVAGMKVPTGLILFFLLFCGIVYYFFKTKLGVAIDVTGQNEKFAISSGINTARMRSMGIIFSNILAAIGIIVYAQSYGFLQLYNGPMLMAFPAVAGILIGGATLRKATISHVIFGTLLFQTLLTIALPVTSRVIQGDISEVARLIISNGMILYALTRGTGRD